MHGREELRVDGRRDNQLRPVRITRSYLKDPEGSVLIELGETKVLCTATVEGKVPPFLRGMEQGWVTAEYAMLPRSTQIRVGRERGKANARSLEIQRLIGRSLRAVTDLTGLGDKTVLIDCDVIQADGGTRTAAVSGSFVALVEALAWLRSEGALERLPIYDYLCAVSVGLQNDRALLDLAYEEDAAAEVDMNIVMTAAGKLVEVQGSAEGKSFSRAQLDLMLDLAQAGIVEIVACQKEALGSSLETMVSEAVTYYRRSASAPEG